LAKCIKIGENVAKDVNSKWLFAGDKFAIIFNRNHGIIGIKKIGTKRS